MYNSSAAYSYNNSYCNKANTYLANDILNASPEKLLIKIYDFAIVNCKKQNIEKTNKALRFLTEALKYDTPESTDISNRLSQLYDYCQDQMRLRNYDIVEKILTELRESWDSVFSP